MKQKLIFLIISLGFITSITIFFFVGTLVQKKIAPSCPKLTCSADWNTPETTPSVNTENPKTYFSDSLIAISKNKPYVAILATVDRLQTDTNNYGQTTRISFFDGKLWQRNITTGLSNTYNPVENKVLKKWALVLDNSRVLKETADISFNLDDENLSIQTNTLENELPIRSTPGYTKFMSVGTGTLKYKGTIYEMDLVYAKIYSLNQAEIPFYQGSLGVETDWLAFWDNEGNFYHIDSTQLEHATPIYNSHKLAFLKTSKGVLYKTFNFGIQRDNQTGPKNVKINRLNTTPTNIELNISNTFDKHQEKDTIWKMGIAEGTANSTPGRGIYEYIKEN